MRSLHPNDALPTASRPRVVIVGGGFAGLACARSLRGEEVEVLLVDHRNYHTFQPLLYQVATGSLSPSQITAPLRTVFRAQGNLRVRVDRVTAVDLDRRLVVLRRGSTPYDYLVLAMGLRTGYRGNTEWQRHALPLKSIEDALAIRSQALQAIEQAQWETDPLRRRRLLTFVIIGGGPTGVELAGALGEVVREVLPREFERSCCTEARILLLEAADHILPGFPPQLRLAATRALRRRGVEVRLHLPVEGIEQEIVHTASERLEAATIVWAAGVEATALAAGLATERDRGGRIVVAKDGSLPRHPRVFVAGDAAASLTDGAPTPPVAPAAIQMGRQAAAAIRADLRGKPRPAFRYRSRGRLATIGSGAAVAQFGRLSVRGWPAWLLWGIVHIANLVTFRDRLGVVVEWAWSWLSGAHDGRIIIGPGTVGTEASAPDADGRGKGVEEGSNE